MHETISGLLGIGLVDKTTMRNFDTSCLTPSRSLDADQIKAIRVKSGVSQSVFAQHLGITTGLVSKWETGHKHPSRMALKLLSVVESRGLDVIA